MSGARFLLGMGQALATMGLYAPDHPARRRAVDVAYERLVALWAESPRPAFSFLGSEAVLDGRPLEELPDWEWGNRLARVGVQRLEFAELVGPDVFASFLEELLERLAPSEGASAFVRQVREGGIRYGAVRVRGEAAADAPSVPRTATLGYHLGEEVQAVRWIHDRVETAADLPLLEADTVVRSLAMAMRAQGEIVLPLLELKTFDQYTTTHSLNVSVLAMALAERRGLSAAEVRAFGVAGLLHDLGKVRIPREILVKPGALTEEERAVMRRHPADGARLILERERRLDLAAVVAYEHHIMIDGRGYPELRFRRDCHAASKLVHVCDVYDALRTRRPYRDAWESERALAYLEEHAGTEFDAELVRDFAAMMRRYAVEQVGVPE